MKKKKQAKVKVKDFDSMTVSQVMEKDVQYVRLKTKGDVIASLTIEGFGAVSSVEAGEAAGEDQRVLPVTPQKVQGLPDRTRRLVLKTRGHLHTEPLSLKPEQTLNVLHGTTIVKAGYVCRVVGLCWEGVGKEQLLPTPWTERSGVPPARGWDQTSRRGARRGGRSSGR